MTAYEMMLSESQERMLMVLHPEKEAAAEAIFRKWGLEFAVIGKTTDSKRFVVKQGGEVKADLPIKRTRRRGAALRSAVDADAEGAGPRRRRQSPRRSAPRKRCCKLLGSPDLCSKRWVAEQYDTLILGNTIEGPGGDAAVIRLGDGPKGLALTTDANERYCEADPVEGGRQAVAEAWRNLIAVGARPLALTDCLNFGNPEKPEAMGQFVGCLEGIGEAARALDFPVVSGNVSLYNETSGVGIPPTPTIGGVGLIEDVAKAASLAFKREGEAVLLIGGSPSWLGRSAWLATILRPRRGRAAAGRSRRRAAQRRVRAVAHPLGTGQRRRTTSPTAASRSRWRKWRWRAASARRSIEARSKAAPTPFCSARTRAAMS